jgi:site-specific DNA-methyltransferase (adenine-specific)
MKVTDKITITNEDNMLLMARYPDNYFDLAIVDPPYNIGGDSLHSNRKLKGAGKLKNRAINKFDTKWDNVAPTLEYFNELKRVSKNWIIWGGNYFELGRIRCFIAWDKCQPWENFSQVELAYTSFEKPSSLFKFDNRTSDKIHPTQKPVALYQWILDKYANEGDKILDTHLGSGSIAIACHDYGFELTACELDKEYYDKAIQRIVNHTNQTKLF